MDVLSHYKIVSRNTFERILFDLEMKLGVTRGRASVLGLDAHLMSQELDNVTRKCNQLVTSIAYQERGQVFIKDLAVRVREELLIQYVGGSSQNSVLQLKLQNALYEIRDITENCYDLAMNTIHQISCLEKRAQTLINVIYIMVAQRDNRISIEIAAAAKRDSSIVTAIAVLTMVFLPATFTTSLFGMNFFNFDNGSRSLLLSKTFWLFWAISLPLTIFTLSAFSAWVWRRRVPNVTAQNHSSANNMLKDHAIHSSMSARSHHPRSTRKSLIPGKHFPNKTLPDFAPEIESGL